MVDAVEAVEPTEVPPTRSDERAGFFRTVFLVSLRPKQFFGAGYPFPSRVPPLLAAVIFSAAATAGGAWQINELFGLPGPWATLACFGLGAVGAIPMLLLSSWVCTSSLEPRARPRPFASPVTSWRTPRRPQSR